MWFFDRWTPSGRGRRDGRYWRVIHERLGMERWQGEKLLEVAMDRAEKDYFSHTLANVQYHSGYIYNFIFAYTAQSRRNRFTDELTRKVKDASIEEMVERSNHDGLLPTSPYTGETYDPRWGTIIQRSPKWRD